MPTAIEFASSTSESITSLAFFFDTFLPIVKACQAEAHRLKNITQKNTMIRNVRTIWDLFGACLLTVPDLLVVLPTYKKALLRLLGNEEYRESALAIAKAMSLMIRCVTSAIEMKEKKEKKELDSENDSDSDSENDNDSDSDSENDSENDNDEESESENNKEMEVEEEEEEVKSSKKAKDTQWDEVDGMQKIHVRANLPAYDMETLQAIRSIFASFIEPAFIGLQDIYASFHGDYGKEVPKFSGVGKHGDVNTVAIIRDILEVFCSIASPETVSRLFAHAITQLNSLLEISESEITVATTRQQIVLVGVLSAIIRSANEQGMLKHNPSCSVICFSRVLFTTCHSLCNNS